MRARSGSLASSVALGLALAACPGGQPTSPTSPTATASPSVTPRGVARVAVAEEPPTLDPLTLPGLSPATRDLLPLVTPVIGDGPARPGSVRARITRTTGHVRIEVLPGSAWSDGRAITAADIVRTWRRVRAARVPFEGYHLVTDARLEGGAAVLDLVPAFDAAFPGGVRVLPTAFSPAAYARAWPVSGGAFRLERWTPGLKIRYTANPTSPGGPPALAAIEARFVPDPEAALALLRRGEIDVLPRFGSAAWHDRLTRMGARTVDGADIRLVGLAVGTRGALASASKRRALLARVDLARINGVLVQEEATVRCDTQREASPCASNPAPAPKGPKASDALVLAFESSDALAGQIAVALRHMLGPVRLQARTARSLWTHLDEVDLLLVTTREGGGGAPEVLAAAGGATRASAADARVLVMFRARAGVTTRAAVTLDAPGPGGPFDGAGSWPSSLAAA